MEENAETLARKFHDTYERLAPDFGYETRLDTKAFDPGSANGKLMTAVCHEVAGKLESDNAKLRHDLETAKGDYAVDVGRLQNERDALMEYLEKIFVLGHNDDCMFCGFKDKEATLAMERFKAKNESGQC